VQGKLQLSFDLILQFDRLGHRQPIRALAMASDDSLLLSGSTESLKLWSCGQKFQLLKSWPAENCIFLKFLPKDRFFVTGSKTGVIRLYDLRSSEVVQTLEAHSEAIWSLDWHEKPAGSQGINLVSGSSDGTVKFWSVLYDKEKKTLKLKISRRIELDESVQWVQYTPDGQYYACALLNNKINIYYSDSDKLFLSLYGHKLPVMCFDISSDNTLVVSASADKNVKIWGMDFGDCHRSIWAHDDSITQVRFVKDTHYFITVSKDKSCKFWDGDKFILVMDWNDHYSEIWALCLSSIGDFFVTGGNDMAMRAYLQGKEQVFANIEENVRQEKAIVQKAFDDSQKHQYSATPDDGPENA
jgi:U3 small nucleolar RNA-associated protein 12